MPRPLGMTGANDAVSAITQATAIASDIAPTRVDKTTTRSKTDTMGQQVCSGKESLNKFLPSTSGTSTNLGLSLCPARITTRLFRKCRRHQDGWNLWKFLRKEIDPEDPTPLLNQLHLGCTQREAEVDHHAVQAKAHLFRRFTTTAAFTSLSADQMRGVTTWNHTPTMCRQVLRAAFRPDNCALMIIYLHL